MGDLLLAQAFDAVVDDFARFNKVIHGRDEGKHDPQARAAIAALLAQALTIKKRVESILERPFETIFIESFTGSDEVEKDDLLASAWRD